MLQTVCALAQESRGKDVCTHKKQPSSSPVFLQFIVHLSRPSPKEQNMSTLVICMTRLMQNHRVKSLIFMHLERENNVGGSQPSPVGRRAKRALTRRVFSCPPPTMNHSGSSQAKIHRPFHWGS